MNKIRNRFNRFDTVFNRLITSFVVLVVVVALFIGGILTVQFSVNYNQKIEKLERYRLEYLASNMNALLEDTNQIIQDITNLGNKDEDLQKFLYFPKKDDFFTAVDLLEYLHNVHAQNDSYVASIELYTLKNDIWISTFTGINYTDENQDNFIHSLDIFKTEISFQGGKRWISNRIMKFGNYEIPVYSFAAGYPLYISEDAKRKGYIIVNVKEEVIRRLLSDFLTRELDSVAIMNRDGEIVTVEGNIEGFHRFLDQNPKLVSDILTQTESQKGYRIKNNIVTSQSVGIAEWKIINLVSTKDYYDETHEIQANILFFSIGVILVGLIMSYLFAKNLYKPFYLIINRLNKVKLSKKAKESEYYYIDRAIGELCSRAEEKEKVLYENRNIIKRDFVANLISGKLYEEKEIDDKLKLLGYKEGLPYHYVLIIRLHQKIYKHLDELTKNMVIYNMIHFLDNYSDANNRCLAADLYDGKLCVLFSSREKGQAELAVLRNKFLDYVKMNLSVDPIILQSVMYTDIRETHERYNKLNKLLEYLYFLPHTYLIDEEELGNKLNHQRETMNLNFEPFSEALVTRNLETIKTILRNFVEEAATLSITAEYLNGAVLKYVFIYNHFMRDILKESREKNDTQMFKDIYEQYDVEDFYFWFVKLIEHTFEELDKLENNPTETVITLIEKVILDNLEEDVSLEFIAEKVYLSPKYISRIFKEETGINITQYITDCKLKKAAKLLLESNVSLEELIKQVGFGSTNYFIKKFKEKYSITPMQYRRNSISS
jgi:AraC-like DNA-binding protein